MSGLLEEPVVIDGYEYKQFKEYDKDNQEYVDLILQQWENCYFIELNVNDIFAPAADSEHIDGDDIWDLDPLIQDFGFDAIKAYVSLVRDSEPWREEYKTKNYKKCRKIIRELKDNHGLFDWFEYGVSKSEKKYQEWRRGRKAETYLRKIMSESIDEKLAEEVNEFLKKGLDIDK